MPRPRKWHGDGEPDVKEGDIVVFVRDKNDIVGCTWRIGVVDAVEVGEDGVCRRVNVKYRKGDERGFRYTRRSVRHVAVLAREAELDLAGRLSSAQKSANIMFLSEGFVGGTE